MAAFENALRNPMLDWGTGVANPAAVATRYITVFDGEPGAGGTEVINTITGSANRQDLTSNMAAAAAGVAASNADITFTANAVGAATVNWCAVYSAITGGTLLAKAQVTPKAITIGDSLSILSGNATFGIS
jgi:hypothetical protein